MWSQFKLLTPVFGNNMCKVFFMQPAVFEENMMSDVAIMAVEKVLYIELRRVRIQVVVTPGF